MDLGITGKLALITGAAGEIGAGSARALARDGARLLLSDTDADGLSSAARDIASSTGAEVETALADLTSQEGADSLAEAGSRLGGIDICVHAAGITGAKGDPLELEDSDYSEAWSIDFMSAVRIARAIVPAMAARGWGRVVYVASENAVQSYSDEMPYNVAKAALVNFTRGTAQVYAPQGVLINVVSPAFIETDMTDQMMEKRAQEMSTSVDEAIESFLDEERPHLVLERRGRPTEVAAVIAFLCSEAASFVVGSNYRVDGGAVLAMNT
ncbi:SDR family NAD(P)-dependent oxidoreductase [Ilumatobacter sp.]|uniref:SDR family NAD(P)-dependent oxidoreductase n=1 Tax=Ilumatobacter sp. TaxID=1967498 RepID=UPI003B523E15